MIDIYGTDFNGSDKKRHEAKEAYLLETLLKKLVFDVKNSSNTCEGKSCLISLISSISAAN